MEKHKNQRNHLQPSQVLDYANPKRHEQHDHSGELYDERSRERWSTHTTAATHHCAHAQNGNPQEYARPQSEAQQQP
jgi:hypothetical protein